MALGLTPKQIIEKNKYPLLNICKDWERVLLGNIIEIQNGYAFSSVYFTREEGVPLIRIRDIADKKTENYFNGEYSDHFVVRKGDFLIGMDGDFKLSKWPGERGLLNQRVCRLRNESELYNKQFLFYVLQPYLNAIHSETSSVTVKHLSSRTIAEIPIPLPSLPEQRAIVKKLESLFSSLDAGVADLKKAQQQLKIYRQAVLKKAFENIKSEISLEEIKQESLIGLVKSNAEQNAAIGVPYIKMNNINMDGGTDIKNVVYVDASASEIEKYSLLKGDILINTRNSFELVGKSGIITSDLNNYTFNNNLMRLRLKSGINPLFVFYQIIGPGMRKMMVAEKKATTSICALYQRDIFPLKAKMIENIDEQNEIVKEIESRLSVCDSMEQNIKEGLAKAEALRQSILKKAFEGNLLTAKELEECKMANDYEPASVLLERIKAEQNKAAAKPSKKKVAEPLVVAKTETPVVKISADIHAGLIAKVIKIHEENPASIDNLSHIKCEKIAHLVEYHLQIPLGRQPVKDAAGPDDYPHLKSVESRAKKAGFFNIVKKPIGYSYSSASNSGKVIDKFQSALSDEKNRQLDNLIALFLKFDLEVSEIIATTYAGWNNLILNGNANPSDEEIVYESRENWSERKLKIARERFFKAIEWMRKNEIVPTGYGAVVPFPKKKK